jgi:hypothetical protein
MLKVISTSKLKQNIYSVEFNDGILLNIKYIQGHVSGEPQHMCSLGLDSYFATKGYFPKGHNLRKRLLIGTEAVKSRSKRYRRDSKTEDE